MKRKNQNRKIATNRERFLIQNKMSELSNETENQNRKIRTNREIFVSFIIISELSNKAKILKNKNCTKPKTKYEQKTTLANTS